MVIFVSSHPYLLWKTLTGSIVEFITISSKAKSLSRYSIFPSPTISCSKIPTKNFFVSSSILGSLFPRILSAFSLNFFFSLTTIIGSKISALLTATSVTNSCLISSNKADVATAIPGIFISYLKLLPLLLIILTSTSTSSAFMLYFSRISFSGLAFGIKLGFLTSETFLIGIADFFLTKTFTFLLIASSFFFAIFYFYIFMTLFSEIENLLSLTSVFSHESEISGIFPLLGIANEIGAAFLTHLSSEAKYV